MKKGFTLAEVLITMSIIAVVALMTIPTIVKNFKYKSFSSTLKQTIAQIEDVIQSSMADENATVFVQSTGGQYNDCTPGKETGPCYLYEKYIKTSITCADGIDNRCLASEYKSLKGDASRHMWNPNKCGKLPNGATVCMVYNENGMNSITHVGIDVNGAAYPNIIGIDLYTGRISQSGQIVDNSSEASDCGKEKGSWNHVNDYAYGCLTKVMENDWVIKDE